MNADLLDEMVRRAATVSDAELTPLELESELHDLLDATRNAPQERREVRGLRPAERPRKRGFAISFSRPVTAALLIAIALVGTVATVSPVRAALEDLGDSLAGYFDGDDPPGRPLEGSDSPPAWLVADGFTGQRVIASAAGFELYVVREPSGNYGFGLNDSVGISDSPAGWDRQFESNAVVILGRSPEVDESGRVPLYGVTAGNVASIKISYENGPESVASTPTGGFVAMVEPERGPTELIAIDRDGEPVQVLDVHRFASDGKAADVDSTGKTDRNPVIVGEPSPAVDGP